MRFELTVGCPTAAFQATGFNHSPNCPVLESVIIAKFIKLLYNLPVLALNIKNCRFHLPVFRKREGDLQV